MGLYDYFTGNCNHCGQETMIQTKLFECALIGIRPGDSIDWEGSAVIRTKDICECGNNPVVVVENGVYIGFQNKTPTHEEGSWGSVSEV